jgi:hypothetical protein
MFFPLSTGSAGGSITGAFAWPLSAPLPSAFSIASHRSSWLTGLGMKSVAPLFIASTTLSGEEAPDSMITGSSRSVFRISRSVSSPSLRGIMISSSTSRSAPVPLQASQYFFSVLRRFDRVAVAPQSHLQIAAALPVHPLLTEWSCRFFTVCIAPPR